MKAALAALLVFIAASSAFAAEVSAPSGDALEGPAGASRPLQIFVIPVREEIAAPVLYIIRNGVKDAVAAGADFVVLDMDTLGGDLGATLEIMEILEKFAGETVTYVNDKAVSAGAFISAATHRIYFAPRGVIGAAAPVSGSGQDIDKMMQAKILSFLGARVRVISEGHRYRGEVVTAMMDLDYELTIDGTLISPKGKLLSLTAPEAMKAYGDPPQPILGAGIVKDLPALFEELTGGRAYTVREFEMTWSIRLAQWLNFASAVLLALGGLMLAIEFKTPGFGWVGLMGIGLILVVLFGHNVAGLSGHEPMLVFLLGAALVFTEIFLFPGTLVLGAIGGLLMLGSLLWGMADIWPRDVETISPETFVRPAYTLALGFLMAVAMFLAILRFLPKTAVWNRMVLAAEIKGSAAGPADAAGLPAPGTVALVVSPLHPTGTIEVDGRRLQARVEVGAITAGTRVRVIRRADLVYIVEAET